MTMTNTLAAALAVTLTAATLLTGTALAQDTRTRADATQVTEYRFDDHAVGGGTRGPDGDSIRSRLPTRRDTLIQPRIHYVNEMLKSVEAF